MNDFISRKTRMDAFGPNIAIDPCEGWYERSNLLTTLTVLCIGAVFGMVILTAVRTLDRGLFAGHETAPMTYRLIPSCTECHRPTAHAKMTEYFKRSGSPVPAKMATAVLMTSRPRLLAAIATVETQGNPSKRNTGYRHRHHGSFQVNPRYWGKVSSDPVAQAMQADKILDELIGVYGKKALSVYGGDSTSKYQRTVLAELAEVP